VVEDALERVFVILRDKSVPEEERLKKIEDIAFSQFDFDTMSRLVLARNWKRFTPEQRTEFISEYQKLLSRSYGTRLDRFGKEKVEVTGEQAEQRGDVTVFTKITGGDFDGAQINYRMRKRDDSWRAIDVVIEGISLVSSYRAQFKDIVSKKGPDGLLDAMRRKNIKASEDGEAG